MLSLINDINGVVDEYLGDSLFGTHPQLKAHMDAGIVSFIDDMAPLMLPIMEREVREEEDIYERYMCVYMENILRYMYLCVCDNAVVCIYKHFSKFMLNARSMNNFIISHIKSENADKILNIAHTYCELHPDSATIVSLLAYLCMHQEYVDIILKPLIEILGRCRKNNVLFVNNMRLDSDNIFIRKAKENMDVFCTIVDIITQFLVEDEVPMFYARVANHMFFTGDDIRPLMTIVNKCPSATQYMLEKFCDVGYSWRNITKQHLEFLDKEKIDIRESIGYRPSKVRYLIIESSINEFAFDWFHERYEDLMDDILG